MNVIIQSTLKTLQKSQYILANLSNEQLSNNSIPPYYSSIGSHIRHILDFYDCILNKDLHNQIDLTARSRNRAVENCCILALEYLSIIIERLKDSDYNIDEIIIVKDDLGLGKIEMPYTLGAVLSQANSHTIHHYAIINYILNGLNIPLEDSDFGYNPSTPKQAIQINE
ncbi:hypothetical protein [Confluentibacter citreus]|uniref:hypothetical protein n=1 Tax=Confluentibacter citreus TaxID=2007307 RepID=UPI000C287450|nr:hypothetical protein [Confluentibacter citreus]